MSGNRVRAHLPNTPRSRRRLKRPKRAERLADKWISSFEKHRALAWGLQLLAASERELTDRTLYMEFEPRHFCKQIDIASADGAAA